VTRPVESNAVFAVLPRAAAERLQKRYRFYFWDEATGEVRWMCSFDTTSRTWTPSRWLSPKSCMDIRTSVNRLIDGRWLSNVGAMELIAETTDPSRYLDADEAIDHRHPLVRRTAARLRAGAPGRTRTPSGLRPRPRHRHALRDAGDQRVTWRASDVLEHRTGMCYAKAHALTALLRAEASGRPLLQRLTEDDGSDPVLHGLIALWLPGRTRWSRVDPRGNKAGVDARFELDRERLAWPVRPELGERDYPTVYAAPAVPVLAALRAAASRAELVLPARLPDPVPPS